MSTMKRTAIVVFCSFLFFSPTIAQGFTLDRYPPSESKTSLLICQSGRDRALQERAEQVTHVKDELIRRTLRAYGGDYFRVGQMTSVTLNGRTYKDCDIKIVRGEYLIIKTFDDIFLLEIVEK